MSLDVIVCFRAGILTYCWHALTCGNSRCYMQVVCFSALREVRLLTASWALHTITFLRIALVARKIACSPLACMCFVCIAAGCRLTRALWLCGFIAYSFALSVFDCCCVAMTHDKCTSKDGAPETVKQQRLLQDRSTEGLQDQRAYLMNSASRKRKNSCTKQHQSCSWCWSIQRRHGSCPIITTSHHDLLPRHQKRHKRWPKRFTKSYNAVHPRQNLPVVIDRRLASSG